jgi:hypothetical protein
MPSEAAIVDAAAARGVEVVRSRRRDINALRGTAAVLLSESGSFRAAIPCWRQRGRASFARQGDFSGLPPGNPARYHCAFGHIGQN